MIAGVTLGEEMSQNKCPECYLLTQEQGRVLYHDSLALPTIMVSIKRRSDEDPRPTT